MTKRSRKCARWGCIDLRVVKDAWRNYTAHLRGKYDDQEAEDMLANVRGFMQKLATRLHE
jgi:hypothetical protein